MIIIGMNFAQIVQGAEVWESPVRWILSQRIEVSKYAAIIRKTSRSAVKAIFSFALATSLMACWAPASALSHVKFKGWFSWLNARTGNLVNPFFRCLISLHLLPGPSGYVRTCRLGTLKILMLWSTLWLRSQMSLLMCASIFLELAHTAIKALNDILIY